MRTSMRCAPLTCSSMHQLRGPRAALSVYITSSILTARRVSRRRSPLPSPFVLTGHAASLTPY
jgi:hypothetical protein